MHLADQKVPGEWKSYIMRSFIINFRVIKSRRNKMGNLVAHTVETRKAYKIFCRKD